jgi:type VI secretion system protein ImpL
MLAQIEAAQRLREMFFRPGSERPQVGFTVSLTDVDAATTRFVLEVDGQTGENKHQGVQKWPMKWPGSVQGRAVVTFEDVASLWPPRGFEGPWAWFRLIDAGQPRRESDRRLALTFQNIGHRGSVVVEPDSIRNPFTDRGWQRASCGR